jgi:ABC-type sugar transport system substrate-binding protein
MVNTGENWDVAMISDNFQMAELMNLQAAQWVEKTFPDAKDGSIECVAVTYYSSQTNKDQAQVALEIENYSPKIKLVEEYQLTDETTEAGITAAENIFTNHPNVKLIITAQGTVAVGINNYLTSMNSPVKDYSGLGIFSCNASSGESFAAIAASGDDSAPMRGTVMTGGVDNTIGEMLDYATRLMDGSIEKYTSYAPYELLTADSVGEFLEDGTITSYTQADLYEDMEGKVFYSK